MFAPSGWTIRHLATIIEKTLGDFSTGRHGGKPFTWSVTERGLNNRLASLEGINWLRMDGRSTVHVVPASETYLEPVNRMAREQAKR